MTSLAYVDDRSCSTLSHYAEVHRKSAVSDGNQCVGRTDSSDEAGARTVNKGRTVVAWDRGGGQITTA